MNEVKIKNGAPWLLPSWQTDMELWIESILEKLNEKVVGESETVKVSELCNIQKVPTTIGDVYFKAVLPQLRFEVELSRHLYSKFPKKCAQVVGIDAEKGWLLLQDIKGKSLRELKDRDLWQRAIGEYATLQIHEIGDAELFLSMGVTDRRLPVVKKEIEENLEAMCATGLNEEETATVLALKNELIGMCDELNGTLPDTIEHGDLHSANMRFIDGEIVFFDWGDASVTHPFLSTRVFWNSLEELIEDDKDWMNIINGFRPFYLEAWKKVVPVAESDNLDRLLAISDQLGCVYRALSWYLHKNPYRADASDLFNRPAQWLQLLLEHRELVGLK